MFKINRFSLITLVAVLTPLQLVFASSEDEGTRIRGHYQLYERDDGSCTIYHEHSNGKKVAGIRGDHLNMLEQVPGKTGEDAKRLIDRWFDRSDLADFDPETENISEVGTYLKPQIENCRLLGRLKDALNVALNKFTPKPKKLDLHCTSDSKNFYFNFRLDNDNDLQMFMYYRRSGNHKNTRELNTTLVSANPNGGKKCVLRIGDDKLRLCLPSTDPSGASFETEITYLELEKFKKNNPNVKVKTPMTVTCKASSRLYKSSLFKEKLAKIKKNESDFGDENDKEKPEDNLAVLSDQSEIEGESTAESNETIQNTESLRNWDKESKPIDFDDPFNLKAREQFPLFGTGTR